MVKVHQLQAKLKALRLGGMLDTLELRLDKSQQGKLGYLQFLEMMLEDEVGRRSQRSLTSRISKAHFEEIKTLVLLGRTISPSTQRFPPRRFGTSLLASLSMQVNRLSPVVPWERERLILFRPLAYAPANWAIASASSEPISYSPISVVVAPTVLEKSVLL